MISIVICCYNSSQRLPKTLSYLSQLKNSFGIDLELVIINNNSSDATGAVAQKEWERLNVSFPLVVHEEQEAGISAARKKGVLCSKYPYILFCDDDNWLASDYVDRTVEIIEKHPKVGIIGGHGKPELEGKEPAWFQKYKHSYAVGKQAKQSGFLKKWQVVYGAGMIINKSILLKMYQKGFNSLLSGRKGKSLSSGEDNEICLWYNYFEAPIFYDEQLQFQHLIPTDRLTEDYYLGRSAEKGKVEALFRVYKNTLTGKPNDFIHQPYKWYGQLLKRQLILLSYKLKNNSFDNEVIKTVLKTSIAFRKENLDKLKGTEKRINAFMIKFANKQSDIRMKNNIDE